MTSNTSISEAQRRGAIHGAVSELASIDPESQAYEVKLAELERHLAQRADRKPPLKPQPLPGQAGPAVPGSGAALWRARWTKQKGRISQAGNALLRALRRSVSRRKERPAQTMPLSHADQVAPAAQVGRFAKGSLVEGQSGEHHPRTYMLYEPAGLGHAPAPLLVLLHGCKQGAADFAAGTRMNEAAEAAGVVVLYPEQSLAANLLRCWNWYALQDRSNKDGDAAVIAAMTRQVMREHEIDATRVYVAGMSAGGGMAAVLVRDYPELYAALGVHSGVPAGLAHDVYSAMRLMSAGPAPSEVDAAPGAVDGVGADVASIVFHGDEDAVVHLSNGVAIHEGAGGSQVPPPLDTRETTTQPRPGHRGFTRSVEYGPSGVTARELWIVHGAGHAWAGGSSAQPDTDSSGPDASREMLRFFLQHQLSA
jgi:poly(hydroxyalkanoate) depolymerase family esterase